MNGFLLHLQGPMMSYGDTGFGQLRDAGGAPSRSAVIGILAAALGIERGDAALLRLHGELRVHTATALAGTLAVDYHTIMTAGYAERDPVLLRREGAEGKNPVLSDRTYHMDAHFVALVTSDNNTLIAECREALLRPAFTGYLGRRSCPPAMPLMPCNPASSILCDALRAGVEQAIAIRSSKRARRYRPHPSSRFDAFLDGDRSLLDNPGACHVISHSYRRDLLVALPRSYVNRIVTHVRGKLTDISTTNTTEDFFDAAP